jgi:hypothetical protein
LVGVTNESEIRGFAVDIDRLPIEDTLANVKTYVTELRTALAKAGRDPRELHEFLARGAEFALRRSWSRALRPRVTCPGLLLEIAHNLFRGVEHVAQL